MRTAAETDLNVCDGAEFQCTNTVRIMASVEMIFISLTLSCMFTLVVIGLGQTRAF